MVNECSCLKSAACFPAPRFGEIFQSNGLVQTFPRRSLGVSKVLQLTHRKGEEVCIFLSLKSLY